MTPYEAKVVEALKDVQLPPEPGLYPPPSGYLALAAIVLIALAMVGWRYRPTRRARLLREINAEIRQIQADHDELADDYALARRLGGLMRRVALVTHGATVAGLQGAAWSGYLENHAPQACDPATWSVLAVDRYKPGLRVERPDRLIQQCRTWLRHAV